MTLREGLLQYCTNLAPHISQTFCYDLHCPHKVMGRGLWHG
jgi:hypothetical protein